MQPASTRLPEERVLWLEELYRQNLVAVGHYCRRLLKDGDDAVDATHEVFLRAIASLDAPAASARARAWLLKVARNHCLDVLRHRQRTTGALSRLEAGEAGEPSAESRVLNRQLVRAVLQRLEEKDRRVLWQTEVEDRPLGEVARRLGVTYMAAAQAAYRARRRASVIAANLGGVLGVLGWRALRRRWQSAGLLQPLAVVAIIPLVATVAVATASGAQRLITSRPFEAGAAAHQPGGRPVAAPSAAAAPSPVAAGRLGLGRVLPSPVRDTLHSTVQSAGQLIKPVTKPLPTLSPLPSLKPPLPTPLPSPPGFPRQQAV